MAVEMIWFFPRLGSQINLAVHNTSFDRPQPLIRLVTAIVPRHVLFTPEGLTAVYWVAMAAGLLAVIGLFTRPALFVYALGYAFFVSHAYSYADVHHREALYVMFVLALAFSPAGDRLSVDALLRRRRAQATDTAAVATGTAAVATDRSDLAMWPLRFLHVLLAMTYFSTGITKLLSGGLRWINGYTLQNDIFSDAINRGIPLGIWLSHQHTLCIFLSIGTILFETLYFVSLFLPRLAPFFFLGGLLFHLGLYYTSGHPFYEHMLLNATLLLFNDPDWFPALWRRLSSRLPALTLPSQTP
ncbi:MAG: HTTM domain-containing protein [Gemmatimonadales bacterium]